MLPKTILFTDLDDTWFQSRRKCPGGAELTPVAFLKDGEAHGFQTAGQAEFLDALMASAIVVPVTARNIDAFRRVKIDFSHGAIVNFGGTILDPDGAVNADWNAGVSERCTLIEGLLHETAGWLEATAASTGAGVRVRVNVDHGCAFYVLIKSSDQTESGLDQIEPLLRERLAQTDLQVHRNGNNLVAMPEWLDKRHAVEFMAGQFRARHGNIVTVGMGDSLSDLDFMKACDYMMVPARSQIRRQMEAA